MALTLGKINLLPAEDIDVGQRRLTAPMQDALQTVRERGLSLAGPPQNDYKGEMPSDITSLDDDDLGDLLNNLSAWCAFVESELAKASSERDAAKTNLDFVMARVRLAYKTDDEGKKLTVQDKNDYVLCDPRVIEAQSKSLYSDHVYTLTKVLREKAQRDWETVSRRITQRGQEIDRMKRQSNVAGVPAQATRTFRRPT